MDFVAGDLAMHGRQANMGWEGYVINSSEENHLCPKYQVESRSVEEQD